MISPCPDADLFSSRVPANGGRTVYSVSGLTRDIKLILENTFGAVWVEGEISNYKAASSGHFYFSLKDAHAVLSCVMFSRANRDVKFKIEDGLKVICFGAANVYEPRGQYQLIVEKIEPRGVGARQLAFEQLKKKLLQEGLFDPARKRQLPAMPFRIGIVTSTAGAAVRDILQIMKRGAPCVDIVIRPVRVQGDAAAGEIAAGIADLNRFGGRVDAIIISRGGGSIEDLWPFNEEVVARAVAGSRIPTISAVGHQINTTLSDFAADAFVETPSAAAKLIVDRKQDFLSRIDSLRHESEYLLNDKIHLLRQRVVALRHMLKSPLDRLLERSQILDELTADMRRGLLRQIELFRERFGSLAGRLQALNPLAVLSRGYSLTMRFPQEEVIKDTTGIKPGETIKTTLAKGSLISRVEEVRAG